MPSERTRAPRPYWRVADWGCRLRTSAASGAPAAPGFCGAAAMLRRRQADEQHGPRERRARLDDLAVLREQAHEGPLGPVVQVPRGVPEIAEVGTAGHVEPAPQRL